METKLTTEEYNEKMNTLYSKGNYREFLAQYKNLHREYPAYKKMDMKCCWALYKGEIKNYKPGKPTLGKFFQQVKFIYNHCMDKSDLVLWCSVTKLLNVVDILLKNNQIDRLEGLKIKDFNLGLLDYQGLPLDEWINNKGEAMASKKEVWFGEKIKILREMERWDEISEMCNLALNSIPKLHYGHDIWFPYRDAQAKFNLGDLEGAGVIISKLLEKDKTKWFFYKFLYEIAALKNEVKEAIRYASLAALCGNQHDMKIKMYDSFSKFLDANAMHEEAMLHAHLVYLLHTEKTSKIKKGINVVSVTPEIEDLSKKDTLNKLNYFWRNNVIIEENMLEGVIDKILDGDKSGFIKCSTDGKRYYFNIRDFFSRPKELKVGNSVKFELIDGFDKKKNRATKNAVNIVMF